jgi:hypothetical protein
MSKLDCAPEFGLCKRFLVVAFASLLCFLSWRVDADDLPDRSAFMTRRMPYAAFERLPQHPIEIAGAKLQVAFAPGELDLSEDTIVAWVRERAAIIAKYYGRFPAKEARILVIPIDGAGVRNGTTFGYRGAATKHFVGKGTTQLQLADDWVLVHELVHYAFPDTDDAHLWFSEGQATYIEIVARVQAGARDMRDAWKEIVTSMPKGMPRSGDEGLDNTHTWGRTYWGGAMFCLLADVEIHKRTKNRFGLRDALRGVVNAGGVNTVDWPLDKALRVADDAVGVKVLEELYGRLKGSPGNIELDKLWQELGVAMIEGEIQFNEGAPLAKVRKALMEPAKE